MYKNYSYSNMPVRRQTAAKPVTEQASKEMNKSEKLPAEAKKDCKDSGLLGNFETDDILLLVVAVVLMMDGCDDKLLLAAIAFIFLSDFN